MNFLPRHFGRIQNPVPVFIRQAGGPNADSRSRFHTGGPDVEVSDARRLAHCLCARPVWRGQEGPRHTGLAHKQCADRKSTRLNSSHHITSYSLFSFKKKTTITLTH